MQKWPGPFYDVNDGSVYRWGVGQRNEQAGNFYRMVSNFREVFNFAFFASQEPLAKIKTAKILLPTCKRMNRVLIPGLLLYSSLQKRVSECAFDGYH